MLPFISKDTTWKRRAAISGVISRVFGTVNAAINNRGTTIASVTAGNGTFAARSGQRDFLQQKPFSKRNKPNSNGLADPAAPTASVSTENIEDCDTRQLAVGDIDPHLRRLLNAHCLQQEREQSQQSDSAPIPAVVTDKEITVGSEISFLEDAGYDTRRLWESREHSTFTTARDTQIDSKDSMMKWRCGGSKETVAATPQTIEVPIYDAVVAKRKFNGVLSVAPASRYLTVPLYEDRASQRGHYLNFSVSKEILRAAGLPPVIVLDKVCDEKKAVEQLLFGKNVGKTPLNNVEDGLVVVHRAVGVSIYYPAARLPTQLIALSSPSITILWNLRRIGGVTSELARILQSDAILKVSNDPRPWMYRCWKEFGLKTRGGLSLRKVAARLRITPSDASGLLKTFHNERSWRANHATHVDAEAASFMKAIYGARNCCHRLDFSHSASTLTAIEDRFQLWSGSLDDYFPVEKALSQSIQTVENSIGENSMRELRSHVAVVGFPHRTPLRDSFISPGVPQVYAHYRFGSAVRQGVTSLFTQNHEASAPQSSQPSMLAPQLIHEEFYRDLRKLLKNVYISPADI